MSVVGAFPGFREMRRRTIRAPVNSMDKATIISIYPKPIQETKWTIEPGVFNIPAGRYESPSILVVGPSSWWREIDYEQPLLEIPTGSIQIADSIVKDFCNGLIGYVTGISSPGIAYVPGEQTLETIHSQFKHVLNDMNRIQNSWYRELINMTNQLWARSNGNPLVVSGDARLAANELAMNNLDWMENFEAMDMTRCIFCGSLRNPKFPLCMHCHRADPTHPLTKQYNLESGGTMPLPPRVGASAEEISQMIQPKG